MFSLLFYFTHFLFNFFAFFASFFVQVCRLSLCHQSRSDGDEGITKQDFFSSSSTHKISRNIFLSFFFFFFLNTEPILCGMCVGFVINLGYI